MTVPRLVLTREQDEQPQERQKKAMNSPFSRLLPKLLVEGKVERPFPLPAFWKILLIPEGPAHMSSPTGNSKLKQFPFLLHSIHLIKLNGFALPPSLMLFMGKDLDSSI
jgi:hypothetical protein